MKKVCSLLLMLFLIFACSQTAFAAATYSVKVPSALVPGSTGTIIVEGYWYGRLTISVSDYVVLVNTKTGEEVYLDVVSDGLSVENNGEEMYLTAEVYVEPAPKLYGTWTGRFSSKVNLDEYMSCTCGVNEGEAHLEDCLLYVAPTCSCGTDSDTHAEECPLWVEPIVEEPIVEPTEGEEPTEAEPNDDLVYSIEDDTEILDLVDSDTELTCACGTETDIHIDICPLYVAPASNADTAIEGENETIPDEEVEPTFNEDEPPDVEGVDNGEGDISAENEDVVVPEGEDIESVEEVDDIEQENIDSHIEGSTETEDVEPDITEDNLESDSVEEPTIEEDIDIVEEDIVVEGTEENPSEMPQDAL